MIRATQDVVVVKLFTKNFDRDSRCQHGSSSRGTKL